jgi:hypothetical protein
MKFGRQPDLLSLKKRSEACALSEEMLIFSVPKCVREPVTETLNFRRNATAYL